MRREITDGTTASRRSRAGIWKWSQLVIAPRCGIGTTTLSTRRQSIGLGISLLTWQEIEQEPNSFLYNAPPAADCARTTQVSRTRSSDTPALAIAPDCYRGWYAGIPSVIPA